MDLPIDIAGKFVWCRKRDLWRCGSDSLGNPYSWRLKLFLKCVVGIILGLVCGISFLALIILFTLKTITFVISQVLLLAFTYGPFVNWLVSKFGDVSLGGLLGRPFCVGQKDGYPTFDPGISLANYWYC